MAYRLQFLSSAQREFLKLPVAAGRRLDPHLSGLENDPRPHGVKAMAGHQGLYRIRVGDYRVLYEIDDTAQVVTVTRVRPREKAYRGL